MFLLETRVTTRQVDVRLVGLNYETERLFMGHRFKRVDSQQCARTGKNIDGVAMMERSRLVPPFCCLLDSQLQQKKKIILLLLLITIFFLMGTLDILHYLIWV